MKVTFKEVIAQRRSRNPYQADVLKSIINKRTIKRTAKKVRVDIMMKFSHSLVDIYSFRIEDRRLYAYTVDKKYAIQAKLYEVEALSTQNFIQISKSEIINIEYIHHLELGKNGIIKIIFNNNDFTHSSRRYLKQIKEQLNL